jgi:UrcA family protein
MTLFRSPAAWLIAAALATPALPALASTATNETITVDGGEQVTRSRDVSIADLKRGDRSDLAVAYRRINIAARSVCNFWGESGVNYSADYSNCFTKAVTNARAEATTLLSDGTLASR